MKFFLCFLLTLTKVLTSQAHFDNVMIETIDINVDEYKDLKNNTIESHIEAYRSKNNDQIIRKKETSRYRELEWYSIGYPFLANIHSKNSSLSFANLFQITTNGFNIYIQFLSDAQKRAIIEKIKNKYGIDVHASQVVKLKLSELTCSIDINCDQISEGSIKLNGSSKDFSSFPIKVEFKELDKKTMTCFEQYLVNHQHVDIHCSATRNHIDRLQVKSFNVQYKDERTKYQRLSNEMVDKNSSIKMLKKMKRINSLWSCLEMCDSYNRCHYSEYHDSLQECSLYDKKAHFDLIPISESIQVDLYKRRIYSPKELEGVRIGNKNFMKIEDINDSDSCWEECLKQEKCHMVSYKYDNSNCFLFEEHFESIRIIKDQEYISVFYDKEYRFKRVEIISNNITTENTMRSNEKEEYQIRGEIEHPKYTRYNKTQISGLYISLDMKSEEACLKECIQRKNVCIAVSFGENRCHLVKKGEYQHNRFNNWVSIYLENEAPIKTENRNTTYTAKTIFQDHKNGFSSLAILHNGDLACGSRDTIQIWNLNDESLRKTLKSHKKVVTCLVVLHNGNLVSGSDDNTIKIWNSKNYEVERTLTSHTKLIVCLTVFPNGDFASGSGDNTIIIWNSNGDYKRTLRVHVGSISSLVVLASGKLVSASHDRKLIIWSADGNAEKVLFEHYNLVFSLTVLDNGLFVGAGPYIKATIIWNENDPIMYAQTYDSRVESVAVLPNGDLLIGFYDGKIRIKDKNNLKNQEIKSVLSGHSSYVKSFAVFSNGDFASLSLDKRIIIWRRN